MRFHLWNDQTDVDYFPSMFPTFKHSFAYVDDERIHGEHLLIKIFSEAIEEQMDIKHRGKQTTS